MIFMNMDEQPMHILTRAGILAFFSISKKITEDDIDAILKDAKVKGKSKDEVLTLVKTKIMHEIIKATQNGTLPGIILDKSKPQSIPLQNVEALNHMVLVLSQKMKSKKFDKFSLCYFINYLIASLGLKEEDFEEFHRWIQEAQGDDDDDEDE